MSSAFATFHKNRINKRCAQTGTLPLVTNLAGSVVYQPTIFRVVIAGLRDKGRRIILIRNLKFSPTYVKFNRFIGKTKK